MKCNKETMLLYAITDRTWTGRQTLMEQVKNAIKGGATRIQLREKELTCTGVDGVALVSAIFAAEDIQPECQTLPSLSEKMVQV